MKRLGAVLLVLTAAMTIALPVAAEQGSEEKAFVPGGRIRLNLSAGDYTIKAGREDRILVSWTTHQGDRARAAISIDRGGKAATVVTDGPHNSFRVVIEVPARSDLNLDVSAGEVRVEGITGNKDLGSWAGNIDVGIARAEDYGRVDLRVRAGDIEASPFGARKSGLFRSFTWKGPGSYTMRVRLTAGNLRLYAEKE